MLMIIATICCVYVAGATLLRVPGLIYDALAWIIAGAMHRADQRRASALWTFADAPQGWARDRRAQRALDRATRSALSLTEFVTNTPRQADRAIAFLRRFDRAIHG